MGLQTVPAYIGQTGFNHPVELDRNILEILFSGRSGLCRVGDFAIAPTGTNQQFSIAKGAAIVVGLENLTQGAYLAWSDASENKLVGVPSGQPRIDSVILRIHDDQYGTIPGAPQAVWEVVAGVAASSPVARTDADFNSGGAFYVPGAWFRAADIRVNPGDTTIPGGQITSNIQYARRAGYTVVPSSAFRPGDAVSGDTIQELDTGYRYHYHAAAWESAPRGIEFAPAATASAGTSTGAGTSMTAVRDSVLGSCVFTAQANRYYEVRYSGLIVSTDTVDLIIVAIRDGGASTPTTGSTLVALGQVRLDATGGPGQESLPISLPQTFSAGTHTLGAFISGALNAGSRSPIGDRKLYVVDLGPV